MIIEIISAPEGQSPYWVRLAWVGVRIRTVQEGIVTVPTVSASSGVASRLGQIFQTARGQTTMRQGYLVNARDALGLLTLKNEDAAKWCIDNTPQMLNPKQVFLFDKACCRPVSAD